MCRMCLGVRNKNDRVMTRTWRDSNFGANVQNNVSAKLCGTAGGAAVPPAIPQS